jgi:signal transduction histidine kinase
VRNISLLLRPSLLDDLGLGPALQWHTEEFTRRTGVPCELVENIDEDVLPDSVRTCVYRVVQEALRNCEKHSGATSVRVTVWTRSDNLEVIVEDNGRGFNEGATRRPANLGVLGMKERASALNGTLETTNRPGGGAVVRLSLPFSAPVIPKKTGVHA